MASKTVLRMSARSEILWRFHVVLDSVPEGAEGSREFVRRILTDFGISEGQREKLTREVCAKLPDDLGDVEMDDVLAVFEQVLPIEWQNDKRTVGDDAAASFRKALLRIFAERKPGELPAEVTAHILAELESLGGAAIDPALVPATRDCIENLLVSQLWRSKDVSSQQNLADWVIYDVERLLRLDLGKARRK